MLFLDKHLLCFALGGCFPSQTCNFLLVDDSTYRVFMFSKGTYILDLLRIFFCFDDEERKQRTSSPMVKSV